MLARSPIQQVLVILDTCYAGTGARDIGTIARDLAYLRSINEHLESGLWLIAAARPFEEAEQTTFVDTFERALAATHAGQSPAVYPTE